VATSSKKGRKATVGIRGKKVQKGGFGIPHGAAEGSGKSRNNNTAAGAFDFLKKEYRSVW